MKGRMAVHKNTFCHVEIPTTDINKAGNFYSNLFGWEVQPTPDPGYALIPGGGLRKVDMVKTGGTINYIYVNQLEPYLEKAEGLGGKILIRKEPAGDGWCSLISDPEGTVLGLYTE